MANNRAAFFKMKAHGELERSKSLLGTQYDMSTIPYYSGQYHAKAILFPFAHAYHALKNLGQILEGACLCVHAVFNEPSRSLPVVLNGMLELAGALILNVINAMASIVTFITKTIATGFNLGYTSTAIDNLNHQMSGREVGGRNEETTMNLIAAVAVGFEAHVAHGVDEFLTTATLSM